MLLSIVIPVKCTTDFLDFAIRSLANDIVNDFEIVLIDDGCDKPLANNFNSSFIKHFKTSNSSRGISAALNTGILNSKGKYITFFDADDILCLGGIKKRLNWLLETNMPVIGGYVRNTINEVGEPLGLLEEILKIPNNTTEKTISKSNLSLHRNTFFFSHSLLMADLSWLKNNVSFDTTLKHNMDLDFLYKVASLTNITFLDLEVFKYRIHSYNHSLKLIKKVPTHKKRVKAEGFLVNLSHGFSSC